MSFLDRILNRAGLQRIARKTIRPQSRRYAGAAINRLTNDWLTGTETGDAAIRYAVKILRDRSRQQEKDSCFFRRFLSALENNVLGADGINLQMKIRFGTGRFDTTANDLIETAWAEWGKARYCTTSMEEDWVSLQRLLLRSTIRDGGVLCRIHRGRNVNAWNFALQPIEIDYLDTDYNEWLPNDNEVRMGIEKDPMGRIVRYYLLDRHPGDYIHPMRPRVDRIVVPAEQMVHYFVKDRITQTVGVPWGSATLTRMHHLADYHEAELIASKAASSKGGWFQSEHGDEFQGEPAVTQDADGNVVQNILNEFQPGSFDMLPAGMQFHSYDPTHPTDAFGNFVTAALQEIAAGLDLDYATLTGDLSKANYSSMRSGKLEVWETYKKIQGHFIQKVCIPIFEAWLQIQLINGKINLPFSKFDTFNTPKFRGRRWAWVDPEKDVSSALEAIRGGLQTRTEVIAQNGGDLEDVYKTLAEEQEMAEELGLKIDMDQQQAAEPKQAQQAEESSESEDSEEEDETEEDEENNAPANRLAN